MEKAMIVAQPDVQHITLSIVDRFIERVLDPTLTDHSFNRILIVGTIMGSFYLIDKYLNGPSSIQGA